jgi:hypothetical protein
MSAFMGLSKRAAWISTLLLGLFLAGCGGDRDPILGAGVAEVAPSAPTVTAVAPVNNATGVPLNTAVTAEFSEPMAPIIGAASFKLTCLPTPPCTDPSGTVTLDATGRNATLMLTANLAPLQLYTATITDASSVATGLELATPYTWSFTTGSTANAIRPRVSVTSPITTLGGPTPGVPVNSAIAASFSESMAVATINANSFTVTCAAPCVSPTGTVTYEVGSDTAIFTPTAPLTVPATYTATITTAATDLTGNALAGNQAALPAASNYVWTFSTATAVAATNVTVQSTSPTAGQTGVCPNAAISATFSLGAGLRMDPTTVNAANFMVTGPSPAVTSIIAASVALDAATGKIATFTPQTALAVGMYSVKIIGGAHGVEDLAIPPDDMLNNATWTFTAGAATGACQPPVVLGSVSTYGDVAGVAGMTNTGTLTEINGNLGTTATVTSAVTGFHDTAGDVYTETPANIGAVNGTIYSCTNSTTGPTTTESVPNCLIADQALADAQTAYTAMTHLPPGATPAGNLGGITLAPGVYTAAAGILVQGGNLTLDAGGNANAVWVFQIPSTLIVGGPGVAAPQSIILAGGAQAKNVFWQVGSSATINAGGGGTMVGTIIASAGVSFSTVGNVTVVTLNGRAMSLNGSVTVVDTVINVPAP